MSTSWISLRNVKVCNYSVRLAMLCTCRIYCICGIFTVWTFSPISPMRVILFTSENFHPVKSSLPPVWQHARLVKIKLVEFLMQYKVRAIGEMFHRRKFPCIQYCV